jgi:hypothetical protein
LALGLVASVDGHLVGGCCVCEVVGIVICDCELIPESWLCFLL